MNERLERERAFHDSRFGGEMDRDIQDKYYVAIAHGRRRFEARVWELARDADVLEVGCATGGESKPLVGHAATVRGIDLSPVAVDKAQENGVDAEVRDAEATTYPDASFDLIFGAGIVHHLDVAAFGGEVARLLRPGGTALFWEPLGHNVAFNLYRHLTPSARTDDEHPLLRTDLEVLSDSIGPCRKSFFGVASIAGAFIPAGWARDMFLSLARSVDRMVANVPGLRWQSWYVLCEFDRRAGLECATSGRADMSE